MNGFLFSSIQAFHINYLTLADMTEYAGFFFFGGVFEMYIIDPGAVVCHDLNSFQVLGESTVFYIHAVCACVRVRSTLCLRGNKHAMNTSY